MKIEFCGTKWLSLLLLLSALVAVAQAPLTPLGQAFEVNTPWKMHWGDDPRWAQPSFDDSQWRSENEQPRQNGFAWYRMTLRLPDAPGPYGLWIPRVLKSAEFFLNGKKLGAYGSVDKWYLERRDLVDVLPLPATTRAGDTLHIAVRVKRAVSGPGIPAKPVIGPLAAVAAQHQLALLEVYREAIVSILMSFFPLVTALVAFFYWRGKAERQEALWVGAILLGYFFGDFEAYRALGALQGWTLPAGSVFVISLWGAWRFFNGSPSLGWKAQAPYLAILGLILLFIFLGRMEFIPWTYSISLITSVQTLSLLRNGVDTWRRVRQGEKWVLWFFGGYLLATMGTLVFYAGVLQRMFTNSQVGMKSPWNLFSDPFLIDLRNVGEFVSGGIMVGILLRRLYLLMQEKQTLAAEFEAAQQVQNLLLPGAATKTPGFAVESAYRPALQVGGDFYFVKALADGRLLVVVGDVSGKGLRAAMLVSVVVGILRTAVPNSASAVLTALNAGLVGHTGGGFVTACSVLFEADGSATIANAGHCPVYRDGAEVAMESSLPLGVLADATFEEVQAAPGCFVLLSDGVVEAENAQRELFGFERTREISGKSAQEIAQVAQAWGQTDDITVVTVRRSV